MLKELLSKNEFELKDGIWYSKEVREISYHSDFPDIFFEIEDSSNWFRHRNNCILSVVKKYSPSELIVDIGGGNGFVSTFLQKSGIETLLIEPGQRSVENARKRGLNNIICASIENINFDVASIPSIGLFDVVEHIENDTEFLTQVVDLLQPNGLLYLTVPAYNALWSEEDIQAGHFRRYSLSQIAGLLKSRGLTIEYSTYMFSLLPIPIYLMRSIPTKLGFGNKNAYTIEKTRKDHGSSENRSLSNSALNYLFQKELNRIQKGKSIPFGSSCMIVARKPAS